jgi:hypothetical protein
MTLKLKVSDVTALVEAATNSTEQQQTATGCIYKAIGCAVPPVYASGTDEKAGYFRACRDGENGWETGPICPSGSPAGWR